MRRCRRAVNTSDEKAMAQMARTTSNSGLPGGDIETIEYKHYNNFTIGIH